MVNAGFPQCQEKQKKKRQKSGKMGVSEKMSGKVKKFDISKKVLSF